MKKMLFSLLTNGMKKAGASSFVKARYGVTGLLLAVAAFLHPCLAAGGDGGIEKISFARLTGLTAGTGTSPLVTSATADLTYTSEGEQSKRIRNIISLSVIEETNLYIPSDFTASVSVRIEYGPNSSSVEQYDQTFTVTFDKDEGAKYNAKHSFSFEGAEYVKITVLSITAPTLGSLDTREVLLLQNEMRVTRYFELDNNVLPTSFAASGSTDDELSLAWAWPTTAGNNATQLEWTWVEDELKYNYYDAGGINHTLLFRNNATRIDLAYGQNSFKIPLFYDGQGKLYYRIRAVNVKASGNRSDGPWSAVDSFAFAGHEDSLNWQVRTSFAEEGKLKTVMEYYDGSLRSRQTVTRENINHTVISAETFYDAQGRPAVQILPTPGMNSVIAYTKNLNRFNGQSANQDPAKSFDLETIATPGSGTPALLDSTGSSQYYSAANPELGNGAVDHIPDAEGYPYTVTRYTPDATGRILSQSGVGAAMKMGTGREIKYFYGSAAQEELNGLFGTEAGNKTHYFKNMVKDANGQMSVSYVDMHGRTIATALAGEAVAALDTLDNHNAYHYPGQGGQNITRNLLDATTNMVKGNAIEAINTILVPVSGAYTFRYKLNPETLVMPGCSTELCYDCMYNLEISITDESGDQAPVVRKYNNISLAPDDDCSTSILRFKDEATNELGNTIQFTDTLLPGSYIVRKTLTLSEATVQRYKEMYMEEGKGYCKTEQELIDSVYNALVTVTGCGTTTPPTCQDCLDALGSDTAFRTNYLNAIGNPDTVTAALEAEIAAAYQAGLQQCSSLCNTASPVLSSKRQLMLADMMPFDGQYATRVAPIPGGDTTMYKKYNIFFPSYSPSTQPYYKKPWTEDQLPGYYANAYGQPDPTIHPAGATDFSLLNTLDRDAFAQLFVNSWARSLLPHHPEYDRLVFAETNLAGSYNWINTFNNTQTYAQAATAGYIIATGSTTQTPYNDPFYTAAPAYQADMVDRVTDDYRNGWSMWQIAYGSVKCSAITDNTLRDACFSAAPKVPPFTGLTTAEKDQVWKVFRSLYAAERDNQVNDYIAASVPLADAEDLVEQGYLLRFPANQTQAAAQYGWDNWFSAAPGDPGFPLPLPQDSVTQHYASQCASYIDQWKRWLLQCDSLAHHPDRDAILDEITEGMEAVCIKGTDAANPQGSSTVAPGTPVDGSPRSFEAVIDTVFAHYQIPRSYYCNPYVIEFPKPYGQGPVLAQPVITQVDSCYCERLSQIQFQAGKDGVEMVNNLDSLNAWLSGYYQDTISVDLWAALQHCGDSVITPLAEPVSLPAFMTCGYTPTPCLSCVGLSNLVTEFKTQFDAPYDAGPVFTGDSLGIADIETNRLFARFVNYRTGYSYSWADYAQAAANASPACDLTVSNAGAKQSVICASPYALNDTTGVFVTDTACHAVYTMAVSLAQHIYQHRTGQLLADFETAYRNKCMAAKDLEQFRVNYDLKEFHYTLYYYDMAGNLVKTVPPAGVRPDFEFTHLEDVDAARAAGTTLVPAHQLVTEYRYNSLNQVVAQQSPDGGFSQFWYDRLGRLAVSRNAQQALDGKYSYTRYDALGRITEVGQKPQATAMTQTISQDPEDLNDWIITNGGVREQITFTQYDLPYGPDVLSPLLVQRNLRNRVSYTAVKNLATDDYHYAASFYTYDIHGNVDTLLQDYKGVAVMNATVNRFKLIAYDYDLISGKVNGVSYQPGKTDAFYHRYAYDAENRLTEAWTSRDSIVWERDAAYNYYKHGPLSRTELGQLRVQGMDYAYTLQGWLKGVNSTVVGDGTFDIGKDGATPKDVTARDVLGFGLYYYDDYDDETDYKAIGGTSAFARPGSAVGKSFDIRSLYNGNIAGISIHNAGLLKGNPSATNALPLFYNYGYDQLNRIISMVAAKGLNTATNEWAPVVLDDYEEAVSYDPNGNILTYNRRGAPEKSMPKDMDQLKYYYYYTNTSDARSEYDPTQALPGDVKSLTNQLAHVDDAIAPGKYAEDIDDQAAGNYTYDAIGNLVADVSAGITRIGWTVYGKIDTIEKTGDDIYYTYDATGNRITKKAGTDMTVYVRDAQGNVLSVYEGRVSPKQEEIHLYGSGRLGILGELTTAPQTITLDGDYGTAKLSTFTRGEKLFELSNHLGNVLATITDKKIQHDDGSGEVEYYTTDVATANDYYPFGMGMPGRKYAADGAYRYGFNGKEMDNEVSGDGNQYDYGFRIYNPRIGKFLSVDPLTKSYPMLTPYQFASNNPIFNIDVDGLEGRPWYTYDPKYTEAYLEQSPKVWGSFFKGLGKRTLNVLDYLTTHTPWNVDEQAQEDRTKNFTGIVNTVSNPSETVKNIGQGIKNWGKRLMSSDPNVAGDALAGGVMFAIDIYSAYRSVTAIVKTAVSLGKVTFKVIQSESIRVSQETVSGKKFESVFNDMKENGWKNQDPIDIVKMEDDIYTTFDHNRLVSSEKLGLEIKATSHNYNDPFPLERSQASFQDLVDKGKLSKLPETWGEAIKARVLNQSKKFATQYPNGSFVRPRITGTGNNQTP